METIEEKGQIAREVFGTEFYNLLTETNPKGNIKEFIKMGVEFGFKKGYKAAQETDNKLPISKVVFFELKNGKYLASNGEEITTEFLMKYEHAMFHDNGYVIIEKL